MKLSNEDFDTVFPRLLPEIKASPSLLYLDQNGIKFLSPKYFLELEKVRQCDFLYFVSASYFWRFGDLEEFKIHFPIDLEEARRNPYRLIHRSLLDQLRQTIPSNSPLQLYPFSIQKGSNIYGIIFGATHPRAVDKFLSIAWKRDEGSGEANFDINEDAKKAQYDLFEPPKLTKLEAFQQRVEELVLDGSLRNNFEVLDFALKAGHLGRHAAEVLRRLKKDKRIDYNAPSPLVTYDAVHKDKRKLTYEVQK